MPDDVEWAISSSGHHMFVSFNNGHFGSTPGFTAKIYYGNEINTIKIWISKM